MPPVRLPERWAVVPDWPDYEVSTYGRVRSLPRLRKAGRAGWRRTKLKYPKLVVQNYIVAVKLNRMSGSAVERRRFGVANLVLRTFVRPPTEGEVARHYHDPNPANCHLYNLRWGTQAENVADETRHYGKHHSKGVPRSEETKAKIGAAHLGRKHTEEAKANIAAGARNRPPVSEETKAKQAASQKAYWAGVSKAERSERVQVMVAEAARIKRLNSGR